MIKLPSPSTKPINQIKRFLSMTGLWEGLIVL